MKERFGYYTRRATPEGGTKLVLRSTADYSQQEMIDFIEKLRAHFAAFGLDLLWPGEVPGWEGAGR